MKFIEQVLELKSLKTGDLICMRYELSPSALLIRFAINLRKPKELRSPYNHIAMVVMIEGKPFIAEAIGSGFGRLTSAKCRLKGKKVAIRRPDFPLRKSEFNTVTLDYVYDSPKYDYKGTFVEQAIFQLTGYKKNKSEKEGDEKLYCSEAYARMINVVNPDMYNEYYLVDPQDLYIDIRYTTLFEGKVKA
jgi:hypothetical protein